MILLRLLREHSNLRHQAASGNCDLARADVHPPRRVQDVQRLGQVVVIGQRLAHAHDDKVVHQCLALWQSFLRILSTLNKMIAAPTLHGQHLIHDFEHFEVPTITHDAARAKLAAIRAADLCRDTQRVPVTPFAILPDRCRDKYALDELAIGQPPEKLDRPVARNLFAGTLERLQTKGLR